MRSFEGNIEDLNFLRQQASRTYKVLALTWGTPLEVIHQTPVCSDFASYLLRFIQPRWPNSFITGRVYEYSKAEQGQVIHHFLNLGNDWIADGTWQQFRDEGSSLRSISIENPPPRLLVTQGQDLKQKLLGYGVSPIFLHFWENWDKAIKV